MLTVDHQTDKGCTLLRLSGDLDAFGVNLLRDAATSLQCGLPLLLDLSAVHFIDAAGIGALVGIVRRNRERGGSTALVAGGSAAAALRRAGMDRIVTLAETNEAAAATLRDQETAQ